VTASANAAFATHTTVADTNRNNDFDFMAGTPLRQAAAAATRMVKQFYISILLPRDCRHCGCEMRLEALNTKKTYNAAYTSDHGNWADKSARLGALVGNDRRN
jgi:hypothetical protein